MAAHAYLPFEGYEEEFKSLQSQVQESLSSNNSVNTSALLSQCEDLLQQMAVEARSVPDASMKRNLLQKVRTLKAQLQPYKEQHDKQELMAIKGSGNASSHRERLLQQQDQLKAQNDTLQNARRVMEETEQVALEIGDELAHNRETLESAHGRVHQVSSLTGRAKRIVQNMNQRAVQQKIMLYGLSASIIVVFVFLLWWLR